MSDATGEAPPALKEIFNADRIRHIAHEAAAISPAFGGQRFLAGMLEDLPALSLMARLRRVAEQLHAALAGDYRDNLAVLRQLAARLNSPFVTMALPEYVALYGADDFQVSMEALRFFTTFGSSEFAVRHFLRRDLHRTLEVMTDWSRDENDHVRRLASEGSRPRLPWSFQIEPLTADPAPLAPILDALQADPSPYVRRSVANSLNDIAKDNPDWVLDRLGGWPLDDSNTAWIAKQGLRSLIKQGDRRALTVIGAGEPPHIALRNLMVTPARIALGGKITLSFELQSTAAVVQRLVVDYAVHYVKKSGAAAAKVFKLKLLTLAPGATARLEKTQLIDNFTTRIHYPGRHAIDVLVNGEICGRTAFDLQTPLSR